jgi:DNA-binding transcriptional regulator/RsmH inhibitor MraZ
MRLPSVLRDAFTGDMMMSFSEEGGWPFLSIGTRESVERLAELMETARLEAKTRTSRDDRADLLYQEITEFGSVYPISGDDQGRFGLPPGAKEHAGIVKKLVIIGSNKRIIVFAEETYLKYMESRKNKVTV